MSCGCRRRIEEVPRANDIYQSFKGEGKLYRVLDVARDSCNPEQRRVIYEQLYDGEFPKGEVWSRSLEEFVGYKNLEGGKTVKRFTLVE